MDISQRLTVVIAILVLFLGKFLNRRFQFLRSYNIPEPVTGGVLVSVLFGLLYFSFGWRFHFHLELRDTLLIVFFTIIGLSSELRQLLRGGTSLMVLLVLAVIYLWLQNVTGIGVMSLSGQQPMLGILGGSISLSGGHGTAIAWAPVFRDQYGVNAAMEIGIACATFGLIFGGVIGGPIAKYLIQKNHLVAQSNEPLTVGISHQEKHTVIDVQSVLTSILVINIAVGIGLHLNIALKTSGVFLPDFVACLFTGIFLTNAITLFFKQVPWPAGSSSMALISDLCLGLFLAMSLMSLQLWTLVELALPVLLLLLVQIILVVLFTVFVVFNCLGRSYDAAVICSGYAGLALGATPTAIANMTAVTQRFGPSAKAFIVVPLIGAFFIDICNAIIIETLLRWLQ